MLLFVIRYLLVVLFVCLQAVACAQLAGGFLVGKKQPAPFNSIHSAVNELRTKGVSGAVDFILEDEVYRETEIDITDIVGLSEQNTLSIFPASGVKSTILSSGTYAVKIMNCATFRLGRAENSERLRIEHTSPKPFSAALRINASDDFLADITLQNLSIVGAAINSDHKVDNIGVMIGPYRIGGWEQSEGGNELSVHVEDVFFEGNEVSITCSEVKEIQVEKCTFGSSIAPTGGVAVWNVNRFDALRNSWNNVTPQLFLGHPSFGVLFQACNVQNLQFVGNVISKFSGSVEGMGFSAFYFKAVGHAWFYNNVINGVDVNVGLTIDGNFYPVNFPLFSLSNCQDFNIVYNSINLRYTACVNSTVNAVYLYNQCALLLKNNIIKISSRCNGKAEVYASIYHFEKKEFSQQLQSDNNIFWFENTTNGALVSIGRHAYLSTRYSLEEWRSLFQKDNLSLLQRPSFISETNLHLSKKNSVAIPFPLIEVDFDGQKRNTEHPDAGAYEAVEQESIQVGSKCALEETTFLYSTTGSPIRHHWHFGDGHTSTHPSPTHTYQQAGTYTVRLDLTQTDGSTETLTREITIYPKPSTSPIYHKP